jgi:protein-disulfide isomerase
MKLVSAALLLVIAAGCTREPSRLDPIATPPPAPAAKAITSVGPSDPGDRLARLERRLDKVISFLDQNLPPAEPEPNKTYSVAIEPIDPVEGPADAKVTIVEAFEFLCPYCYMVNPTVQQIVAKYPKDVRLVSKYLVIHGAPAIAPGLAACAAAKQGKYKEMKAALWAHLFKIENGQPKLQTDQVDAASLEKIAGEAGLDVAKLKAEMEKPECQQWLRASQEAMRPLGATATPAFFINGRFINGAQPIEKFEEVIQQEMAKADKAIADGVSGADYYQRVVVGKGEKTVKGRFED